MTDEPISEQTRREADYWVTRLTSGAFTAADADALNRWRAVDRTHRRAFAEANWVLDMATAAARSAAARSRRVFMGQALGWSTAAAAGFVYAAYHPLRRLWPAVSEFTADVRTATGEQRTLMSGGGAAITVNTATSLNLAKMASGVDRIELVAGEAAITAADSKTVTVEAADGRTTASDAEFVVRYDGSPEVEVTCVQGTVDVACGGRTVTATSGQKVSYGAGQLGAPAAVDVARTTAWREGRLVFRDEPLIRAVAEINRYRPGRIVVVNEALGRTPVALSFQIANLGEAPRRLADVFGGHLTTLPGGFVLLS